MVSEQQRLLSAISWEDQVFCGVAVEPASRSGALELSGEAVPSILRGRFEGLGLSLQVWKHLEAAYHLAQETGYDHNVALVQALFAALGESAGCTALYHVEELSTVEMEALDPAAREERS
eukprot:Skav226773  [mRNA]  locus=scaffold8:228331:229990:- [translate_table: standard]